MKARRTLPALVAAFVGICAAQAHADVVAFINYPAGLRASEMCAQALRDSASRLGMPNLKVMLGDNDRLKALAQPPQIHISLMQRTIDWGRDVTDDAIALISMPFVFRDAAHFNAFIKSDVYYDMQRADQASGDSWIAVGYGGFFQLFSIARAMTEPAHFYERTIGGAPHAQLFRDFNAMPSIAAIQNFGGDIEIMKTSNDRAMAAVEAPLLEAQSLGLDKVAKFVNLDSSAADPVVFRLEDADKYSQGIRQRVVAWAERAAEACSASNFAAEQATLEALKQAGLTVVPANRPAFRQAGWRYAMTRGSIKWTTSEFDRVIRLGATPPPAELPSAFVQKLEPKQRTAFLAHVKETQKDRDAIASRNKLHDAVLAVWSPGVDRLARAVEQTDLAVPAPTGGKYPVRPAMTHEQALANFKDVDRRASLNILDCGYNSCARDITEWCDAARALWLAGDRKSANRIFAFAMKFSQRTSSNGWYTDDFLRGSLIVLAARIMIKDPDLPNDLVKAIDAMVLPDSALKSDAVAAQGLREDRVRYIASIAILLNRIGNRAAAANAFARATEFANEMGSSMVASVARAYSVAGDLQAARALAAVALEGADPDTLRYMVAELRFLRKPLAAPAAQLLEAVALKEKPAGVKGDNLRLAERSGVVDGWTGDWIDHLAMSVELYGYSGDKNEVARLQQEARAADNAASPKLKELNGEIDSLLKRGFTGRDTVVAEPYEGLFFGLE